MSFEVAAQALDELLRERALRQAEWPARGAW